MSLEMENPALAGGAPNYDLAVGKIEAENKSASEKLQSRTGMSSAELEAQLWKEVQRAYQRWCAGGGGRRAIDDPAYARAHAAWERAWLAADQRGRA